MNKELRRNLLLALGFIAATILVIATGGKDLFWNSVAIGGLMVYLWLLEILPIYVTALLPFVFGIPLGVLTKAQISSSYGDTNVYLFMGGFILALALEKHHIHTEIAKRIIKVVGNSKAGLLLGFILSTGLLSMWISNTATALMMLPMALAVIASLPKKDQKSRFSLFLILSIAYAASIGGMATLVGSPPNLLAAAILKEAPYNVNLDFATWFQIGFPVTIIMLAVMYAYLLIFMGKGRKEKLEIDNLQTRKWNKTQLRVLAVFGLIVILWSFKQPIIGITGVAYDDFAPAILGSVLLFIIPTGKKNKKLLKWNDTRKLPWGILLLFGGGLALAEMLRANGVINVLSDLFLQFSEVSTIVILVVIVFVAIFGTELMSNLALVNVFIPVIALFALQTNYSIIQLCIPVTLAASCAFMLPVGTPPNAIVFSSGRIKISDMAKYGLGLNLCATIIIVIAGLLMQ